MAVCGGVARGAVGRECTILGVGGEVGIVFVVVVFVVFFVGRGVR